MRVRRQRGRDHLWSQVAAADADVDDIGDGGTGDTAVPTVADALAEVAHVGQDLAHVGHDVAAVDHDGVGALVSEGDVEGGAVLGPVELLTAEHPLDASGKIGLPGEIEEERHRGVDDAVLGVVEEDLPDLGVKPVEPPRVDGEQVPEVEAGDVGLVVAQLRPGGQIGGHERGSLARHQRLRATSQTISRSVRAT